MKRVYEIKAKKFAKEFGKKLVIISGIKKNSDILQEESIFYGRGKGNPGMYCIRLYVLLTKRGWKVNEMDFVPSGRVFVAVSLPKEDKENFLATFADWYKSTERYKNILYTVGEKTVCLQEIKYFSRELRKMGVNIKAHTLKENSLENYNPRQLLLIGCFTGVKFFLVLIS